MFDVTQSRELQATILAFKTAPRSVRSAMRKAARTALNREWKPRLEARSANRFQKRVIVQGARANVGSDSFTMLAATSRRPLTGGLVAASDWHGAEFGMTPRHVQVTIKGRSRQQTVGRNLGPRSKRGKVAYPVAREAGPRIVAAWTSGAVAGVVAETDMETT